MYTQTIGRRDGLIDGWKKIYAIKVQKSTGICAKEISSLTVDGV